MIGARWIPAGRPLPVIAKLALAGEIVAAYARARWSLRRRGLRDALDTLRSGAPRRQMTIRPGAKVKTRQARGATVRRQCHVRT